MERNELRDILIACERVRRLAAFLAIGREKDQATIKMVKGMLGLTQSAEQTAMVRAGTFMTNNIKQEVQKFYQKRQLYLCLMLQTAQMYHTLH